MVLILGGMAAGKRTYAREILGYSDADMADAVLDDRPVIYNLQNLVERDPERSLLLLDTLVKKEVVICNEVGGGIIPMTPEGRAARDATGRLCIELAKRANRVVRLVCGIPTVLKEER